MKNKTNQSAKLNRSDLGCLYEILSQRIIGQSDVIARLVELILILETESVPQEGARGAFFFAGPTGCGKTETVKAIAELLFGPGHFAIFDCSEFKSIETMEGLLGNRQGDKGRFAATYKKVPAGVWLFDEIEKAHKEIVHLFLQIVGEGRVTAADGTLIDLSGIYIFVTSNLGSAEILGRQHLPFPSLERHVTKRIEQHLRPEVLGRFDDTFIFRPLVREAQTKIALQKLRMFMEWQKNKGRKIEVDPGVINFLVQRGFSNRFGARPVIKTIRKYVGNAIARRIVQGLPANGRLVIKDNQLELVS